MPARSSATLLLQLYALVWRQVICRPLPSRLAIFLKTVPSHQGWLMVLKSMADLAGELFSARILKFLCLRKLNQDHKETLHSQIRGHNDFNDHPMPEHYITALRALASTFQTAELLQISSESNCQPNIAPSLCAAGVTTSFTVPELHPHTDK